MSNGRPAIDDPRRCAAHSKRHGGRCGQWAIPGTTVCKWHGGRTPQVKAKAARTIQTARAVKAVATYGLPIDVDPADALLEEVRRTAGRIAWLGTVIAELSKDELKQTAVGEGIRFERPSVWVELEQGERKHLVAVCRAALHAGVAERQIRLAERQGELLASAVTAILDGLGLSAEQRERVPELVDRHLRAVS